MATELEKALSKAKYTALPLPRSRTGPNTIYAFHDGQLHIVRNPGTCLHLPVTEDPTADVLQFDREYRFTLSGIVDFLAKLMGIGRAKSELQIQKVKSASVKMGGLAHLTIETGALIDYLMGLSPNACLRDVTDSDHLTVVAALRANTFSFGFRSESGAAVKLSLEEATGLFAVDGTVDVRVTGSGEIVVSSPSIVGVVSWDGRKIQKEIDQARRYTGKRLARAYTPPDSFAGAVTAEEVQALRLKSLGMEPGSRPTKAKAAPKRARSAGRVPKKAKSAVRVPKKAKSAVRTQKGTASTPKRVKKKARR